MERYIGCDNRCIHYEPAAYRDTHICKDGCKLMLCHKDYGFYKAIFDSTIVGEENCPFFMSEVALYKKILGENFIDPLNRMED